MYGTISTPAMGVSVFKVARVTTKFFEEESVLMLTKANPRASEVSSLDGVFKSALLLSRRSFLSPFFSLSFSFA
jgi:hypothetical protein